MSILMLLMNILASSHLCSILVVLVNLSVSCQGFIHLGTQRSHHLNSTVNETKEGDSSLQIFSVSTDLNSTQQLDGLYNSTVQMYNDSSTSDNNNVQISGNSTNRSDGNPEEVLVNATLAAHDIQGLNISNEMNNSEASYNSTNELDVTNIIDENKTISSNGTVNDAYMDVLNTSVDINMQHTDNLTSPVQSNVTKQEKAPLNDVNVKNVTDLVEESSTEVMMDSTSVQKSPGFDWSAFIFGFILGLTLVTTVLITLRRRKKKRQLTGYTISEFMGSEATLEFEDMSGTELPSCIYAPVRNN